MMHLCTWIYDENALALSLHALYRKFETSIPRNETARPRSKFLHSCICERNIYSTIGLPILLYCRYCVCGPIVGMYNSLTDT